VTGTGGAGTLTYTVLPALPTGLSFSPSGVISGTPTVASPLTSYTVTVTDTNSATATATFSLTIDGAVSATTALSSTTLTQNHLATAFTPVTGAGGTGTLTYSILPALPTGLSFSSSGVISGTPSVSSPLTSYTVTVTDSNNATSTTTFSLTIDGAVSATTAVAATNLTANQAAVPFIPVTGTGGFGALSYSVSPALPAGLSFASSTGTITGTPTAPSAANTYTVTVTDANNATSSATFTLTVSAQTPTITITFTVPNHTYGDAAFSVSASSNSTGAFTYSVVSGPAVVSGSLVSLTGAGAVTLEASEAADANFNAATKTVTFSVSTATLTITANNATRLYGATNPVFTGKVAGVQPADSFVETFITSATTLSPVATYPIMPSVTGANVSSYTQNVINGTLTITQAPTSIILSVSSASVASGQAATITAQVVPSTSGTPTGIVTVLDNGSPFATLPLAGGSATYTTTTLSPGIAHVITATYAGDSNFLGTTASAATAGTTTVTVAGADTAFSVIPPGPFTVTAGNAVNFELLLTPQPGAYPGPVTFTMTGLPPGATVTFSPASVSAVSSSTTVQVVIQTAAATANLIRIRGGVGVIALGFLLMPIGFSRRARKRLGRLSLFAILLGAVSSSMVITGCGGHNTINREPQNYTLTVTATSGQVTHVATVSLTVQ
jgi:hypothetical protein